MNILAGLANQVLTLRTKGTTAWWKWLSSGLPAATVSTWWVAANRGNHYLSTDLPCTKWPFDRYMREVLVVGRNIAGISGEGLVGGGPEKS